MGLRMGISEKPLGNVDVQGRKELLPACPEEYRKLAPELAPPVTYMTEAH